MIIWLGLYLYYVVQQGRIEKGKIKNIIFIFICISLILGGWKTNLSWLAWIAVAIVTLLFDLFYDEEPVRCHWKTMLLPLLFLMVGDIWQGGSTWKNGGGIFSVVVVHLMFCCLIFLLLAHYRGYQYRVSILSVVFGFAVLLAMECGLVYGFFGALDEEMSGKFQWLVFLLGIVHLLTQEIALRQYHSGYEKNISNFQKNMMQQQYEEIKAVYLNMRGWRHDYHNHLQVLKAQMDQSEFLKARTYLDSLEEELRRVDTYVKSGNTMIDAVINSKVSLAVDKGIRIDCKAQVECQLSVSDVDLCIILGNILDNAIEACNQIETQKRFIRIYIVINGQQLYISVQNAAKEDLNFEEKNYISKKRGNHGLGMKRVAAIIEKYEGYLKLSNEVGIFGTEITIPLTENKTSPSETMD